MFTFTIIIKCTFILTIKWSVDFLGSISMLAQSNSSLFLRVWIRIFLIRCLSILFLLVNDLRWLVPCSRIYKRVNINLNHNFSQILIHALIVITRTCIFQYKLTHMRRIIRTRMNITFCNPIYILYIVLT